ncbi:hypothetical protein BC936DRAFT_141596 [Jimgerdemannia flammicorona]|uniref:Uncharacterized protein n=1 Tax=Jimgerdemannia flammicorona TaxID=994334 RepID=A0A433A1Z1_9FUNG|nr:hypothetical protein BC936DRAFT_141596 [Jimgerdemannia flammicorona]
MAANQKKKPKSALDTIVNGLVRAAVGGNTASVPDADLDKYVADLILKEAAAKNKNYNKIGVRAYLPDTGVWRDRLLGRRGRKKGRRLKRKKRRKRRRAGRGIGNMTMVRILTRRGGKGRRNGATRTPTLDQSNRARTGARTGRRGGRGDDGISSPTATRMIVVGESLRRIRGR